MADFATSLRHNAIRTSESLQSYLRTTTTLKLSLSDVEGKLRVAETELLRQSSSLSTSTSASDVERLVADLKEAAASAAAAAEAELADLRRESAAQAASLADLVSRNTNLDNQLERARSSEGRLEEMLVNLEGGRAEAAAAHLLSVERLEGKVKDYEAETSRLVQVNLSQGTSLEAQDKAIGKLNGIIAKLRSDGADSSGQAKEGEARLRKENAELFKSLEVAKVSNSSLEVKLNEGDQRYTLLEQEAQKDQKVARSEKKGREAAERHLTEVTEAFKWQFGEMENQYLETVSSSNFTWAGWQAGGSTHRAALTQRSSLTRLGSTPSIRPPYPLR